MIEQIGNAIRFVDVYEIKPGRIQIEAYGKVEKHVNRLRANGIHSAVGQQDHMGDMPYAMIRISGEQFQQSAMNEFMAIG